MPTIGSLFAGIGGFDLGFEKAGFKTLWQCEIDKAAQGVLRRHFPDAKLHSDVREVGAHNLEPVDVLTFGSPCFPAGVLVLTRRGLLPIEAVVVGDEVVSHLGRWQPVIRVGSKIAPTSRLKGQGHPGLVTTEEHPFWASSVGRKWNNADRVYRREFSPLEWIPAKDMKGKMWSSLTAFPTAEIPPMVLDKWETSCPVITPELMWVVGSWVGDGYVRDGKRSGRKNSHWGNVVITDGKGEASAEVARRLTAAGLTFRSSEERTAVKHIVTSAPFARWLTTHFGKYAEGKTIPAWLLGAPLEMREAFLQGYLFADGSRLAEKGYRTSSVSKALTFGIAMLIRCTRHHSVSVYFTKAHVGRQIEGRDITERDSWQAHAHFESRSSVMLDGYRMGLVRECAPTGVEERVYNIEVEGDNSYTADGIIVHNCQDLSVAGKRAGLAGGRSGLFHEAVRVIRELRQRYGKPDFAIWENVPGAFSSNDGRDFAAVVQAMVDLGARDVCWRVLDSRYFGVAQRRRRVFLVADFGGERAEQILFESESLRGNPPKGRKARQAAASGAGAGAAGGSREWPAKLSCTLNTDYGTKFGLEDQHALNGAPMFVPVWRSDDQANAQIVENATGSLDRNNGQNGGIAFVPTYWDGGQIADTLDASMCANRQMQPDKRRFGAVLEPRLFSDQGFCKFVEKDIAGTMSARDYKSPRELLAIPQSIVIPCDGNTDGVVPPLMARSSRGGAQTLSPGHQTDGHCVAVSQPIAFHPTQDPISSTDGVTHAMRNSSKGGTATVAVAVGFDSTGSTADACIEGHPVLRGVTAGNAGHHTGVAVCATEDGTGRGVPLAGLLPMQVRRLTPTECERLQGFPRNWTAEACLPDGTIKQQADGPRYKQLGNAVTVNVAEWIARRLRAAVDSRAGG